MTEDPIPQLTPADPETQSLNGLHENITRLKDLFPEAFSEGKLNFDTLRELLAGDIDDQPEKYGLNWNGKARARRHTLTPTRATLRPDKASSVDWDTTQNLMIEGDNLEVLKLLQRSYAGKVKLIYIDPPYNTGNDFVYPDNYTDSLKNYQELTGQIEDGRRVSSNTESSGRFHTDWLNMMYPRLKLARELLKDDGFIFVSIDEGELSNLKYMFEDVFGSENFLMTFVWKKRSSPDARTMAGYIHDYIVCVAKNVNNMDTKFRRLPLSNERQDAYANPDNDPRGAWASVDMTGQTGRAPQSQYYDITLPSGRTISPPSGRAWGLSLNTFNEMREDGRIWFGRTGDGSPRMKRFLSESSGQSVPSFWDMSEVGSNEESKREVNSLFENNGIFDTPKPIRLLDRIITISCQEDDLILDFFSGSGTTGHAVMAQNSADDGNRRFILVQLPEPLDLANSEQKTAADFCDSLRVPRNIAELTKERLRRAGAKVKAENPMFSGDTGFRVFKLDSSNIAAWDEAAARADLPGTLLSAEQNIKAGRSEWDVLYEVLLKLGLPLTTPIEERPIAGHTVQLVGGGALMACLSRKIAAADVQELGRGMADWLLEQDAAGDSHLLFLDSAFADDAAKLNLSTYLEQRAKTAEPKRTWVVRSI